MTTLTAPSKSATTALMMTGNWLRNVFPSDLYTVHARGADEDGDHAPAVVVTHLHTKDGEPPRGERGHQPRGNGAKSIAKVQS